MAQHKGLFKKYDKKDSNWWIRYADTDGKIKRESTGTPPSKTAPWQCLGA